MLNLKKILYKLTQRMPIYKTIAQGACANSVVNTWFYTSVSFTVPAGHAYLVKASVQYLAGKPIGVGIHTANTIESVIDAPYYSFEASYVSVSPTWLLQEGTYYLFCKRSGSSGSYTNNYVVSGIDFVIE